MSLSRASFISLYLLLMPAVFMAQQKDVSIRIVQNDEAYQLKDFETRIKLVKEGFKIQVLLFQIESIYVFASFSDSVYKTGPDDSVPGFQDLPNLAMAEEAFNKNKELLISKEGWSYWFYNPELKWHRFNKKLVFLDSTKVVGVKSIKQFYLLDEKEEVKVKDNNRPLYLFFVAVAENDHNGRPVKELMRRKLKIEWKNDED